ncbi:hypothetical protein B0H13DRAFT_1959758, partial [Mycena leptocephala]
MISSLVTSRFFFSGICWERSFIPLDIWNAGDSNSNLIESVHSNVNREGAHCTLFGGLKKGQLFDVLEMKTLTTYEDYGIRPSYKTGHISENAYNNLKRKANNQHRVLAGEDQKIQITTRNSSKPLTLSPKPKSRVRKACWRNGDL